MSSVLFLLSIIPLSQTFKFPVNYQISLSPQDQHSCAVLENCGSLMRMWETRYMMMNALEVLWYFEKAHCGFLGFSDTPVFRCPEDPQIMKRRMFIGDGPGFHDTCAGTVKLFIMDNLEPLKITHDSIEKMKMVVDKVVVTGNCCWRLHSKKLFHGRSMTVQPGATHTGLGTVKSVKKLEECPVIF